jgi:hypothetical protein
MNDFVVNKLIRDTQNFYITPLRGAFISDFLNYPIGFTLWLLELNHYVDLQKCRPLLSDFYSFIFTTKSAPLALLEGKAMC